MNRSEPPLEKPHFPIKNYDLTLTPETIIQRNGPHLPNDIRCLIIGPSGVGKSNFLLNLLLSPHGLNFSSLILCGSTVNQEKYAFLRSVAQGVIPFYVCESPETFPKNLPERSTIVFDDVSPSFHPLMKQLFCYGRHKEINLIALCQSYASVIKHQIRDQVNLIIAFRQDDLNLNKIWRDHSPEIPFKIFKSMANQAWKNAYTPFCIDKTKSTSGSGRYRISIDRYFNSI